MEISLFENIAAVTSGGRCENVLSWDPNPSTNVFFVVARETAFALVGIFKVIIMLALSAN